MTDEKNTPVVIDSESAKWRFTCPNGHTSWDTTNHHFWCQACSRCHDDNVHPEFYELKDSKTGGELSRDDIELSIASHSGRAPAGD